MASYTHEYSNFPDTLYSVHNFIDLKDAPTSIASAIVDIKNLILKKKFADAAAMLQNYKDNIAPYMIDANYINALDEELRNLEIYTKEKKQALYYTDNVPAGVVGDVWISSV